MDLESRHTRRVSDNAGDHRYRSIDNTNLDILEVMELDMLDKLDVTPPEETGQ